MLKERVMRKVILSIFALFVLSLVAAACGEEAAAPQIITKEVVVEKEVLVEVPVEVVVTKEVVRTVQVPGETIIVEKEVVRTVEVPGETIVVTKEVVKEVPVEVPGETIIVEKEVVKVVEVERVVEVIVDRIIEIPTVIEVDRVFSRFGEAPELTQLVQAGGIDPVIDRLPSQPMVIPVFGEIGKYGGTLRRFYIGPADGCNFFRLSKVSLVRFSKDGFSLIPSVARGWEVTPDGKTWTFHLREGHRWSDGAPFTADDIMYQYNDVILNDELSSGATPTFLRSLNEAATITKVDDTTIQIAFPNPNFIFLEIAAQADEACYGSTRNIPWAPAHYMQQFHTEFNTGAVQMAKDAGFGDWTELYDEKTSYNLNPDKPALTPWHFTTQLGGQLVKAERNAYFMGVDPEGNQLPYLDGIQMVLVDNPEVGTLKAVQGLLDLQGRHIQLPDFPVLKDGEEKGKYHILTWPTFGGTDVTMYPNQDYPGVTGEAISNRTFRQALSIAIDRDSVNEISFLGLGTPRMNVPKPGHPHYPGAEYEFKFTEFDRALAIEMMDSIYPEKDSEGFRTINGERIVILLARPPPSARGRTWRSKWAGHGRPLASRATSRS